MLKLVHLTNKVSKLYILILFFNSFNGHIKINTKNKTEIRETKQKSVLFILRRTGQPDPFEVQSLDKVIKLKICQLLYEQRSLQSGRGREVPSSSRFFYEVRRDLCSQGICPFETEK